LDVWDLGGRLVREIAVDRAVPQGMRWIWDGRDSNGTAVPAGLYMAKVRGTGNALCAKVLRLR
jgi:flagellar hook assembly protein FlgD